VKIVRSLQPCIGYQVAW